MPWHIERRAGRFCVIKNDGGDNEGCHDSEAAAKEQMAALYAQEGMMSTSMNTRAFTAVAAEQLGEDRRQWIEVMPTGENLANGPQKFTITEADLEVLAQRIRERGDQIPIDYDHSYMEGKGTRSAGWFTGKADVRQTDGGPRLWAEVEWTPAAAESLANREYRFISAEWEMNDRDKKTGLLTKAKDFLAATLTNRPFFAELAAVASQQPDPFFLDEPQIEAARSRLGGDTYDALFAAANSADDSVRDPARAILTTPPKESKMDDLKQIAAELGLGEDASDEDILAAVKSAKEAADAAAKPTPKKGRAVSTNIKAVAEALGLDPDTDAPTVIATLNRTVEAANKTEATEEENERLTTAAAKTQQLEERLKVIEAERKAEQVAHMLAEGVRSGKVIPSEKTVLAKQFASNVEGLMELLDSRADGVFSLAARGSGEGLAEEPEGVRNVVANFDSDHADGVDVDSARLHARAEQSLRAKGKTVYSEEEYLQELSLVSTP